MNTVLVTGATGNVGPHLVKELTARDIPVRAFVRDPNKARTLLGNVDLAVGDFGDTPSLDSALDGVDRIFLLTPSHPSQVDYESNVIDAAAAARVRLIVKISTVTADPDSPDRFAAWQGKAEQKLLASGLPAVLLRSSYHMTNVLFARETIAQLGKIFAPVDDAKIAMIDRRDVAAVAARILTEDGHDGRTYILTGPEAITYHDVATVLSAVLGKSVEFVDVPEEAAVGGALQAGAPEWLAHGVAEVNRELRRGAAAAITEVVRVLTDREPLSFAQFARSVDWG
jgi:uncharacterized protein YbjT (DUF2867 family)